MHVDSADILQFDQSHRIPRPDRIPLKLVFTPLWREVETGKSPSRSDDLGKKPRARETVISVATVIACTALFGSSTELTSTVFPLYYETESSVVQFFFVSRGSTRRQHLSASTTTWNRIYVSYF